ncbi:hypothetical protein CDIK_3043 [Cucumispora dikerogammari]|nr:hypothetical protein CDIK_3043 [Cucumispora dikerogammari]
MWFKDTPIKEIKHELEVGKDDVNTVLEILHLNLCEKKKTKIKSESRLVEVDETKFSKRKGNVGWIPETARCVGGIYRTQKKIFYELVSERNSKILHKPLKKRFDRNFYSYT